MRGAVINKKLSYSIVIILILVSGALIGHIGISRDLENLGVLQAGPLNNPISPMEWIGGFSLELDNGPRTSPLKARTERDPFAPAGINSGLPTTIKKNSLLDGLIIRDDKIYALIKGKMVSKGDWVLGMRVIMIRNDKVVLANNKNMRVLYLF